MFYTQNSSRVGWIQQVYPLGAQALSLLPSIDWSSFSYTGPIVCTVEQDSPSASFGTLPRIQTVTATGTAKPTEYPYHLFGGAAVEVWAKEVPSIPLHSTVEPSGDIDCQVDGPSITFDSVDPRLDYPEVVLYDAESGYTDLGNAYSKWLLKEVARVFAPLAESVSRAPFERPERERDKELRHADKVVRNGNLLVTRVITPIGRPTIKIQVSVQLALPGGGAAGAPRVTDHCIEFLIPPVYTFQTINYVVLQGIPVQTPWALLQGQVDALASRGKILIDHWERNPELQGKIERLRPFYKFDNHCARILWLAKLIRTLKEKVYTTTTLKSPHSIRPIRKVDAHNILLKLQNSKTEQLCGFHFPQWRKRFLEAMLGLELTGGKRTKTKKQRLRKQKTRRRTL